MGPGYGRRSAGAPGRPVRAGRIRRQSRGDRGCRQAWRMASGWCEASVAIPGRPCRGYPSQPRRPMKINLDIECTPEELRGFFGRPDVKPMQEQLLKEVEERLRANVKALDPETMLKTWLPAGLKGFEQLQEIFLNQMSGRGPGKK